MLICDNVPLRQYGSLLVFMKYEIFSNLCVTLDSFQKVDKLAFLKSL